MVNLPGVPLEWREGHRRLCLMRPPPGLWPTGWSSTIETSGIFLRTLAARAPLEQIFAPPNQHLRSTRLGFERYSNFNISAGVNGMLSIIQTFGVYLFWPIWILITTTAAICAAVLIKPNTARDQAKNQTYGQFRPHVARIGASGAVTVFTLLAVFLVCYIAMILVWEDFNLLR